MFCSDLCEEWVRSEREADELGEDVRADGLDPGGGEAEDERGEGGVRRGHGGEVATGRGLSSPGLCLCVGVRSVTWIHSRDPHTGAALLWSEEHGAGSHNYTGH